MQEFESLHRLKGVLAQLVEYQSDMLKVAGPSPAHTIGPVAQSGQSDSLRNCRSGVRIASGSSWDGKLAWLDE